MRISVKMVDGSRIDVPSYDRDDLDNIEEVIHAGWFQVCDDDDKRIILRSDNIISITIHKGDGDDS